MDNLAYIFKPIIYAHVLEMERWRYRGFEPAIYMDRYHGSKERGESPIKGPRGCDGYAAFNKNGDLFGLMEFYFEKDGVYLGLAINPLFVGKGLSKDFIFSGISFLKENYTLDKDIKIEVHRRNIQAIKAYESCGFKLISRDEQILLYSCN